MGDCNGEFLDYCGVGIFKMEQVVQDSDVRFFDDSLGYTNRAGCSTFGLLDVSIELASGSELHRMVLVGIIILFDDEYGAMEALFQHGCSCLDVPILFLYNSSAISLKRQKPHPLIRLLL